MGAGLAWKPFRECFRTPCLGFTKGLLVKRHNQPRLPPLDILLHRIQRVTDAGTSKAEITRHDPPGGTQRPGWGPRSGPVRRGACRGIPSRNIVTSVRQREPGADSMTIN